MKLLRIATRLSLSYLFFSSISINACEMIMGYRTSERPPHIKKSPDNDGLYKDLYSAALSKIGCTLKFERAPAKRIHHMLQKGEIDFYPGLGVSEERKKYMHFIENGLMVQSVILTKRSVPTIKSLSELNGKVMIRAIGTNKANTGDHKLYRFTYDLSVPKAVKAIEEGKAYYYQYDKYSLEYHLLKNPNEKVKLHYGLFEENKFMLGFSRLSKHATAPKGQAINSLSKMDEFKHALAALSQTKEFDDILSKYYGKYYVSSALKK